MLTITIKPQGYMANQMIEYMFARTLQSLIRVPSKIIHYDDARFGHPPLTAWKDELVHWNITFPKEDLPPGKTVQIQANDIDFNKLIKTVNAGKIDNLVICGPLMNLRYYYGPEHYRDMFVPSAADEAQIYECADDEILIHIRAGDVIDGAHRDYFPLPFNYYKNLIAKIGLKPVFMGQIGSDIYSTALKKEFPDAVMLERKSVVADFETMRRARNTITSISSFAWLSTWLSTKSENIHMPMAGFLNPYQRNDVDLIPRTDPRYHFYKFESWKFNAQKDDFAKILSNGLNFEEWPVEKIPFIKNRLHRGIQNKFKILLPVKYNKAKHHPLSLSSPEKTTKPL